MRDIPDILAHIAAYKRDEVAALQTRTPLDDLRQQAADISPPHGFLSTLRAASGPALIAEVKKASPSKGVIRADFDPVAITKAYEAGGARCLSVLTDGPGFQGSAEIFAQVRRTTALPLLRKDFMLDPIQIAESRLMGADAILVILAMVDDVTAQALINEAARFGMDALVETHNAGEMERALELGATLIGVNNRDLHTFHTSLDTFAPLAAMVPEPVTLIAESGIFTAADIERLSNEGAQGFLIGESLMRQDDVEMATRNILST